MLCFHFGSVSRSELDASLESWPAAPRAARLFDLRTRSDVLLITARAITSQRLLGGAPEKGEPVVDDAARYTSRVCAQKHA